MDATFVDFVLNAIVEMHSVGSPYRLEIHVVNGERLGIPENIKAAQGEAILLVMQSDRTPNPYYNYNDRILSWDASFNRAIWRISVYVDDIIGINSAWTGDIITFAKLRASKEYTNMSIPADGIVARPPAPAPTAKKSILSIVRGAASERHASNAKTRPPEGKPTLSVVKNKDGD